MPDGVPATPTAPRPRLLAAARAVLSRDGLEGLTLRAIAREAGVSHGAPLRHFPSLAALLSALAAQGFHELMAEIIQAAGPPEVPGARRRLSRAGAAYVRFAVREPGVFGVMFRPERLDTTDPEYQAAGSASFDQLVRLVIAAQDEGWQPHQPPERLAGVLWSNVHGLAQLWLHGALQSVVPIEAPDELVELSSRLVLDLDASE
jgi:AcrR family transcriptional regulator